jgi:UDP-N-acetyl-D-mannosaminuronic acid dehydrogenase
MDISVLGLGYIGLPTSLVLASVGHNVFGFDVNEKTVDLLNAGKIHIKENGLQELYEEVLKTGNFKAYNKLKEADAYIIAVPTPFKNETTEDGVPRADLSYVESASKEIARVIKKRGLVILESTSPPMTTKLAQSIIEKESSLSKEDFDIAHCPERVLPGKIIYELTHNDRIIGAERKESAERAKALYSTFAKEGNIYITDDVTAEMAKLAENSFRDVNIAFANELSILADKLNIDASELIALANRHPRVNILTPGVGVGGHCLAVDPYFIAEKFPLNSKLIRAAREVNSGKPYFLAEKIKGMLEPEEKTVGLLGLSYKPDIDDFRESPAIKLGNILKKMGYKVIACEPHVDKGVKDIFGFELYGFDDILERSDLVALTARHKEFLDNIVKIESRSKKLLFI